jgi:hypothetical protein
MVFAAINVTLQFSTEVILFMDKLYLSSQLFDSIYALSVLSLVAHQQPHKDLRVSFN